MFDIEVIQNTGVTVVKGFRRHKDALYYAERHYRNIRYRIVECRKYGLSPISAVYPLFQLEYVRRVKPIKPAIKKDWFTYGF